MPLRAFRVFGQMAKSKSIATITIEKQTWSVRATALALQRMRQRGVDEYVVSGTVLALGKDRLQELQEAEEEAIIIDDEKNVSVVIGFRGNRIMVVTVIDKSNVWVKKQTSIERI